MNYEKDRKSITLTRVVATVFVLILHTNGCFWNFNATASYWKTANIIECVFYPAVPLFFMITGITLMDFMDRTSLKGYFLKRLNKAFIPFLAWSLIGLTEKIIVGTVDPSKIDLKYIYQGITGTSIIPIFWFFTSLFIIYLSMPLFAAVEKSKRETVFTYLVTVGFVLNQLIPFLKQALGLDLNTPYSVRVVSGVLLWVPLGWLLYNKKLGKKTKAVIYSLAIVGLLLHICGTYALSMRAGEIVTTFKGYENVPSVLYSVGMLVFLKDVSDKIMRGKAGRLVSWLEKYSFPIYLMQFVFLDFFSSLPFVDTRSILYRLGAPFVMIPIIIGITWVLRKIPVLKRIVP